MLPPSSFATSLHSLTSLLDRCKSMSQLKQIQAQVTVLGLSDDTFLVSKLLFFTAISDSGDIDYAFTLFKTTPLTTFLYNTIIRGFSRTKTPNRSITLYAEMLRSELSPDHLTFPFLLKACARLSSLRLGLSVHCHVAKHGIGLDRFVQNSLIHMYASCDDIVCARKVFEDIPLPNSVSWNAMIDGLAKCGDLAAARDLFDRMPDRDVVSWSAIIDGYVKGGDYREALALFEAMKASSSGPKPNAVTMVSVLCASTHLGALDKGREIHKYLKDNGLSLSLPMATSLVDMYAKCGSIAEAIRVFRSVPASKTDVLIWNAVIGGLAMHGLCKESLTMFREMESLGIEPDEITYLGLLSACAHGGLVDDAWNFFRSLERKGLTLHIEHYACMVDVLGRSGRVLEAFEFVRMMPVEPSGSVLGALLSGCRTHGWVRPGEIVGRRLIELEPEHDGRYVGLSNVYAVARQWDEARTMRQVMERRGVRKAPGFSEVEVDGTLHRFIAHDKTHLQSVDIYLVLGMMQNQMKVETDMNSQEICFL
nr:pentatricopeptide repeat protein AaPPR596 [Agave angustifolia]